MSTGEQSGGHAAERPPLRIGTAERESAAKALDEHLAAGRLGIEEYADRSAAAANATVASELTALFTDLPAPHPVLPGSAVAPAAEPVPATSRPASAPERTGGGFRGWGPRIVAVAPILALVLFFATSGFFSQAWLFFLLIPATGALVYGKDRDRIHDERRALRRGRRHRHWDV